MPIRVAINGFGRIGRSVFRVIRQRPDLEVVAVNDLFDNEQLAYLLRFDSVMGRFEEPVSVVEEVMCVGDSRVVMTSEPEPRNLPWDELEVDVVIESTGIFRQREQLQQHLKAGADKVVLTVPPKDEIDFMAVLGVNDDALTADDQIVSNASCTTNCAAPLVKVLDDTFGIEEGFLTTVHAYTNDQHLSDVPHKSIRRSRAAATNIIPTSTGAARAIGKVIPHLEGRLDGMAMRVPVPDGSIIDLVCRLSKSVSSSDINEAVRSAAEGPMQTILEYSEDPLVSTDIIGNPHSSIFDALSTAANNDGFARVVSWYDNEWGYSNRVVDLVTRMASFAES